MRESLVVENAILRVIHVRQTVFQKVPERHTERSDDQEHAPSTQEQVHERVVPSRIGHLHTLLHVVQSVRIVAVSGPKYQHIATRREYHIVLQLPLQNVPHRLRKLSTRRAQAHRVIVLETSADFLHQIPYRHHIYERCNMRNNLFTIRIHALHCRCSIIVDNLVEII